jgi:hypothetical protein
MGYVLPFYDLNEERYKKKMEKIPWGTNLVDFIFNLI